MSEQYAASQNEEVWSSTFYDSREEAIEDFKVGMDLEGGERFFTARVKQVTLEDLSSCLRPCSPFEQIGEALYDHDYGGGDWSEYWPPGYKGGDSRKLDDELADRIQKTVMDFFEEKSIHPNWWIAVDVQEHEVSENDVVTEGSEA